MKNLIRAFALVAISFLAFSCSEEQDPGHLAPTSIAKLLKAESTGINTKMSSFTEALELTGLYDMLDQDGDYTVFVPNNDAFAAVLGGLTVQELYDADPAALENILKYHIVNSKVLTSELTEGQTVTTSQGQNITFTFEDNTYFPEYDVDLGGFEETSIFANEGRIFARDAEASNGRINVINAVLTPSTGS